MGASKNGVTPKFRWFIMENPMNMDDLGVPSFLETTISHHICTLLYNKFCGISVYQTEIRVVFEMFRLRSQPIIPCPCSTPKGLELINSFSGWWLTYPSEKYESVGMMRFPTEWNNNPNVPNHPPVFNLEFQ